MHSDPAAEPVRGSYPHELVLTATRGAEQALADEVRAILGERPLRVLRGAVRLGGSVEDGYRLCLWSRVASRVLLPLAAGPCPDGEALYAGVRDIDWLEHLGPDSSLAVDFVGLSSTIRDSHFGALRTKDAIVDQLRERVGARPRVDREQPDVRIHVRLHDGRATVSLDLSGAALHKRGVGRATGPAPLKENLAAALLLQAGWPALAEEGAPLLDPMCGSGTFLIEGAGMALDRAPGLARRRWGFSGWRGHDAAALQRLLDEAHDRRRAGAEREIAIFGADIDPEAVTMARSNARKAHVPIRLKVRAFDEIEPPVGPENASSRGLLVTNPPYGERIGGDEVEDLYRELGDGLRRRFLGWSAWVLAGSPALSRRIGLKPHTRAEIHNGPLDCRFVGFDISSDRVLGRGPGWS